MPACNFAAFPCKTNSAMLYTLAMLDARAQGCENALILDAQGHVCETASGNIFWVRGEALYTPALSLPFVPGTVRKRVMELWPHPVEECRALLDAKLSLPAYDQCIKASHVFNLLDARGVISVTERQSYILRVRELAKACGAAWLKTEGGRG